MNLNTEQKTFHVKYYATSTATYFWTYIVDIKFKKREKSIIVEEKFSKSQIIKCLSDDSFLVKKDHVFHARTMKRNSSKTK